MNSKKNKQILKTGHEIAVENGYKDALDLTKSLTTQMEKGGEIGRVAKAGASDFVSKLTLLTLYQSVETLLEIGDYMDIVNKYSDGTISEGNFKEYIFKNTTGAGVWDPNDFVPKAQTKKFIEVFRIGLYQKNATTGAVTVSPQGYQFMKEMTIQSAEWIPYFKNGNLSVIIGEWEAELRLAFRYYMFDKLATKISTAVPTNVINGTATNAFDCFVLEFLPLIAEMEFLSNEFNFNSGTGEGQSQKVQCLPASKLTLYMSSKVRQMINTGIKTQLFNAQLFNEKNILDTTSIHCLGNKINILTQDDIITVNKNAPYIDDSTIIIVANDAIKSVIQVDETATQSFAKNLTVYTNLNVWGAFDILPQGGFVKYINPNLTVMPNSPNVREIKTEV